MAVSCSQCGYAYNDNQADKCEMCGFPLGPHSLSQNIGSTSNTGSVGQISASAQSPSSSIQPPSHQPPLPPSIGSDHQAVNRDNASPSSGSVGH